MSKITAIQELIDILDRLLGPNGCPWDQEQTMQTLRCTVLEETCELIEAIDLNNDPHIKEELGDLLLNAFFLCNLAQKENRFSFESVVTELNAKLIRRHPHVFGESTAANADDVVNLWHEVKAKEKGEKVSILDSVPKGLPGLARAQKVLKRLKKAGYEEVPPPVSQTFASNDELGQHLMQVCSRALDQKLDAEIALRQVLTHQYRATEK
jgi:tetrapyrrole methylase family protein/MazG family protein